MFSAGGVPSKPRQDTGVQGLLQASTWQTDISISGQGYFVVNETSTPTVSNEFLYTRAGSFFQDKSGILRNTAGFYLQAWPTDANGIARRPNDGSSVIIEGITYTFNTTGTPPADTATVKQVDVRTNTTVTQDVAALVAVVIASDSDFDTINNRILVSAASTTTILFKDDGTRAITVDPTGLLDGTGTRITAQNNSLTVKKPATVCQDYTQFTFPGLPADGETMTINGITYTFSTAEGSTSDNDPDIRRDSLADMLEEPLRIKR